MGKSLILYVSTNALFLSVWAIAFAASLLNLANFHHYPLLRPEIAIALLGLTLLGALMGALQTAVPRLAFLLTALFATIVVDLNTSIGVTWFYSLWAGIAIVAFFAQTIVLKGILAVGLTVLLFQLVAPITGFGMADHDENAALNVQATNRDHAGRPAIVHLVLDSYLGLGGMKLGPDDYLDLRDEQSRFFLGRGFQLYPNAYSRHTRTLNSLPDLFAYGEAPPAVHEIHSQYAVPEDLPYFADLDRRGYRTSAVLPPYFDLCVKQKLARCRNFDNSALVSMVGTELSSFDRAKVFGFTLLKLTTVPFRVALAVQLIASERLGTSGRWLYNQAELYPLASLAEFERFTDGLADLRAGEARVAHLLLPHDPYMLNADCSVKPAAQWLDEHGPGAESDREQAYADQIRCLQRRIAAMLDVLDRTQAGREAIVLVHGDHGSRISPSQPIVGGPRLTEREMIMSHSTFFAIRVPGEAPAIVRGTYPLGRLMADFRAKDFASAPRPQTVPAEVLIMDGKWIPSQRRPLPGFDP